MMRLRVSHHPITCSHPAGGLRTWTCSPGSSIVCCWDDIRLDNVLPFRDSREEDDEKHVHPLQLDVIDRIVEMYSNEGEVVLTPFMGVGSEVYSPVSLGRKAIGIELKDSYFKQAKINLELADNRFQEESEQKTLL